MVFFLFTINYSYFFTFNDRNNWNMIKIRLKCVMNLIKQKKRDLSLSGSFK